MKRLILKFKHWLIKKLGGYTEQQVINQRIDVHSHKFQPVVLRAETHVGLFGPCLDSAAAFDVIRNETVYKLAREIIDKKLCNFECAEDPIQNECVYRAEIFLIHPHDAALGSLTRRSEL